MAFFSSCQHQDGEERFTSPHVTGSCVDRWADVNQGSDSLPSPLRHTVPSQEGLAIANSNMVSAHFQLTISFKTHQRSRHLLNTLPYTSLTPYKQISPRKHKHTLHECWQAHTHVLHSHIPAQPHACTHTLKSRPVGVQLRSGSQRERSSLWACCGEEGQMLRAWPHATAAAETHQDYLCWLSLI